ncbi:MAG: tyrosine-type recombinase/integrase [Streptosporangiaceae bacterium]
MSVHERKSAKGKISYEVLWRAPQHGRRCRPGCAKQVHQFSKTFDNRRDAERHDQGMQTAVTTMRLSGPVAVGVLPERPSSIRTFASAARDTIARKAERGEWSAGTASGMRTALGKLGTWAGQDITDAATDLNGAQLIVDGLKYPNRPISLIKATMACATAGKLITSHGMSGLQAKRSRKPGAGRTFIFAEQAQLDAMVLALNAWLAGLGLVLLLMRWCGLRTGEALAVQASDFRDNFKVLRVSRQVDTDGHVTTLKSKGADAWRDVPVPTWLAQLIATHVGTLGSTTRLFRGPLGGMISRRTFGAKVKDAARAAGLPVEEGRKGHSAWTAYQLRHQYATWLLAKGTPIDAVARLLGHSSTTITFQAYSHWMPDSFDSLRALLDAA